MWSIVLKEVRSIFNDAIGYLSIGLASAAELLLSTKSQQKRSASLVMSTSSIDAKSEAAYVSEI